MDNRLGERVSIPLAIRLRCVRPRLTGIGRITNLSRSGALIADCDLQLHSLVTVVLGTQKRSQHAIGAYVTRVCADGVGIEWCEYAPPAVAELLRSIPAPAATACVAPPLSEVG